MTGILDRLAKYRPAVAHFILAVTAAGLLVVIRVILGASGVTGVNDWPTVGKAALDAAAVTGAGILQVSLLAATKLTTRYGAGKTEHGAHEADQ